MTPINDPALDRYQGYPGGLYPEGKNLPPGSYSKAGVALAESIQPLDNNGQSSPDGKIVILCCGMSNSSREFLQFTRLAQKEPRRHPAVAFIDAAQNGAGADRMSVPSDPYWQHVEQQLKHRKISSDQIQIVWLKTALAHEHHPFPESAHILQGHIHSIVKTLEERFPKLRLIYVSSRSYGGYSETDLSPEPIAYETGFAVKWLVEEWIKTYNDAMSTPWVGWGPYFWANGTTARSDGFVWQRDDCEKDGVHPSAQGARKVASKLLDFFLHEPTAQPWFCAAHDPK